MTGRSSADGSPATESLGRWPAKRPRDRFPFGPAPPSRWPLPGPVALGGYVPRADLQRGHEAVGALVFVPLVPQPVRLDLALHHAEAVIARGGPELDVLDHHGLTGGVLHLLERDLRRPAVVQLRRRAVAF